MISILDNSERARRVVLFFYLFLAISLLKGLIRLFSETLATQSGSIPIGGHDIPIYYLVSTMFSYASFAIQISLIVTFLQWFRRAYHNLEKAGYHNKYTNGWAVGFWFIPIANLFIPYQIMKEIWYKTQKEYTTDIKEHGLVRTWWLVYIFGNFAVTIILVIAKAVKFLPIYVFIITIVSIIVGIIMIKKIASFEELFRVHVTADTVGQEITVTEEKDIEEEYY